MKNTFRLRTDEIAQIVYPTFIKPHLEFSFEVQLDFILEPSLRIRLENIRKCPTNSYSHEKIMYRTRKGLKD